MTEITEEDIRAMGGITAIERGLLHVVGKDTKQGPVTTYLLLSTSDPTRGCTFDPSTGELSVLIELQLFYQFGVWCDADKIE